MLSYGPTDFDLYLGQIQIRSLESDSVGVSGPVEMGCGTVIVDLKPELRHRRQLEAPRVVWAPTWFFHLNGKVHNIVSGQHVESSWREKTTVRLKSQIKE
jgi:hypothetical protein